MEQKQIISAFLKAQKEMGNAVKNGTNPHFKSKFADLNSVRDAVIPLLNENGIIVLQPMVNIDGNEYIKTILMHESGEVIESHTKIIYKEQNNPQAFGSAITYARRYGLQSLVCIGAEDDDGNGANKTNMTSIESDITLLNSCHTLSELSETWNSGKMKAQSDKRVIDEKDRLKTILK